MSWLSSNSGSRGNDVGRYRRPAAPRPQWPRGALPPSMASSMPQPSFRIYTQTLVSVSLIR